MPHWAGHLRPVAEGTNEFHQFLAETCLLFIGLSLCLFRFQAWYGLRITVVLLVSKTNGMTYLASQVLSFALVNISAVKPSEAYLTIAQFPGPPAYQVRNVVTRWSTCRL